MEQQMNAAAIEGAGDDEASMARPATGISWPRGLAVQLVLIAIAIVLLRLL